MPRLVKSWIKTRDRRSLLMALDIGVPPLTLHILLLLLVLMLAGALATLGGGSTALILSLGQVLLLLLALGFTWSRHGRDLLPARRLAAIPLYVLWKVPLYLHMLLRGGARSWVRTDRSPAASAGTPAGDQAI